MPAITGTVEMKNTPRTSRATENSTALSTPRNCRRPACTTIGIETSATRLVIAVSVTDSAAVPRPR